MLVSQHSHNGGGDGGGVIAANKAAKHLTAVCVTILDIFKDTFSSCFMVWKPGVF